MKLFARGHPEGRWFKCCHSFPRPRHGWEQNFTQNSPLLPAARGQSAVGSPGLTSDGCWRPEFRVTRLKIPCGCLSSTPTPRAGAAAIPTRDVPVGSPETVTAWAVQGHGSCCLGTGSSQEPRISTSGELLTIFSIVKLKQGAQLPKASFQQAMPALSSSL